MGELEENNTDGGTILEDASGLIPMHVTTRKELYEAEFINITEAAQHYLANPNLLNRFEITRQILFDIHKRMFNKVWNWAGKKRTSSKNIGITPYRIDEEVKKLLDDYNFWIKENMEIIEIASRLHHRLVWIHPFEGGNGRWSRFVANLTYYKNTKTLLSWPENELQLKKKSSFREKYLKALHEADSGSFENLVKLHRELVS